MTSSVDGRAGRATLGSSAPPADAPPADAPTSDPVAVESLSKNVAGDAAADVAGNAAGDAPGEAAGNALGGAPGNAPDHPLRPSRGRLGRRVSDALLVLAGLVAMVWMDRHRPNLTANQAPFPTRGVIGSAVRGRDFAITVDRVALTRALDVPGALSSAPPQRRETDGVWLLVHARLDALREPTMLPGGLVGAPSLRTRDGRVYASAGGRMPMGVPLLTSANASPGMPARGVLVFELPLERLPGAVLVASRRVLSDLDSTVEIDLRLTDDDVRRLAAAMPASIALSRGAASW